MQFIKHGPDIPESLLQAHEEGRVVFFCGAGISYPAGLPGFQGLVDDLYEALGTQLNEVELSTYKAGRFDATLDLLEHRYPGQRLAVRAALPDVLKPDLKLEGATNTHAALLELSRDRRGAVRLVTTNFDRIFQHLIAKGAAKISSYPAPMLPIPKNSRWNGVVYLHGLLPDVPDESDLNRLVLSSGDFGLAYLTERWAARFVSELFRNYVVCFVGYSINDPVLRYMMDALAADRMLGEITPQAYAFGDYQDGQLASKLPEWESKGIIPILYESHEGGRDHSALHKTLKAWSETYRDGVQGKERIVAECAMSRPLVSTKEDNFVGRLLWALSDKGGLPAKCFADLDPVPSLDWLEPLCDSRYGHADLHRFGITSIGEADDKLHFSLTSRPTPYTHARWMSFASSDEGDGRWDAVMWHLARWLARHLDDPRLVFWLMRQGAKLNDNFASHVERRIDDLAKLESDGKNEELETIRRSAPRAVPSTHMRTLWRMILSGRVRSNESASDLYRWQRQFLRDGLTPSLRQELRQLLSPMIVLREPFRLGAAEEDDIEPSRLKDIIGWDVVLSVDHVHYAIKEFTGSSSWKDSLPALLDDLQMVLRDTMDLMNELGEADCKNSRSHWDLPSISPHWQNRDFHDWVTLVELLRDSWLAIWNTDHERANLIADAWRKQPYPVFRRLALYGASHEGIASDGQWVNWLLEDDTWWLWSSEAQRETLRLLVLRGNQLQEGPLNKLELAILSGPPRAMFKDDLEPAHWIELVDQMVWLRLVKLVSGGAQLGKAANGRLDAITATYPDWQLEEDERDEFSHWMTGTGDPGFMSRLRVERAPRRHEDLVKWLRLPYQEDPFSRSDWSDLCRELFPVAARALCALARNGEWPKERWRDALQVWSEGPFLAKSWRHLAPALLRSPEGTFAAFIHSISWWLQGQSKVFEGQDETFHGLCLKVISEPTEEGLKDGNVIDRAINHPVGHVTQALLNWWFRHEPSDGQGVPASPRQIFTTLCGNEIDTYLYGRVLLSANVIALFRVDPNWTTENLLPLFNWKAPNSEASPVWQGFLWSPRLYRPLLSAFKSDFLETASHYDELAGHARQYADVLTYAALDPGDTFTYEELNVAIQHLPQKGLNDSARALVRALNGAGEQREAYWVNRVKPFWQKVWPKSLDLVSAEIAQQLALLAIAAGDAFPQALATVRDWLRPLDHYDAVVRVLHTSDLCTNHPSEALLLLDRVVSNRSWASPELGACLDLIAKAWADAPTDARFRRLMDYFQQHAIG